MVTQTISSPSRKTPPGPTGYPFVGCLPKMLQNPLQFLMNSALEYGGVVHIGAMGWQQVYLISDPDLVKYVLQDNNQNYIKGTNFKSAIEFLLGESISLSEGNTWLRQRRLMQPALHRERICNLVTDMTAVIDQIIDPWSKIECGTAFDIFVEMMQMTQKIVLKTLFGVEAGEQLAEIIRDWNVVYEFLSDGLWAPIKLPLQVPTLKHLRVRQAKRNIDSFIYSTIRNRRQIDNKPNDLLSMLLEARDEESGEGMSDRELCDEIMGLFVGGFETTATTLTWTWYLLSKHPEVERRLSEELATVLRGRTPTFEDLSQLKYTRMVISEAMRLYPTGWSYTRSNLEVDEIGGYHIPANSLILLSPFVTHRLPAFWNNPEGFEPDRFTPERVAERPHYAYYPFGGGARKCMGEIFAMTEMQLIVAMMAQKFRLNLVAEHPVEREVRITLRSRYGMLMTLEPKSGC